MLPAVVSTLCVLAAVALLEMLLVGRRPATVLWVLVSITAVIVIGTVSWVIDTSPQPLVVLWLVISSVFVGRLLLRVYERAVERYEQPSSGA